MHVFVYDGTSDGFYTAVFYAYSRKDSYITRPGFQVGLSDNVQEVNVETDKAQRVRNKLISIDKKSEHDIRKAICNGNEKAPQTAYLYLRLLICRGACAREMQSEPIVLNFLDLLFQIDRETDRMRGFLRFKECRGHILYAPFSPDHDILEYLLPHFTNRFHTERLIIHDIKRKKAAFYRDGKYAILPLERTEIELEDTEAKFENLWTEYYHSVNIVERKKIRQMKNYLPVRYWKFLPEKNRVYSSSSKDGFPPSPEE